MKKHWPLIRFSRFSYSINYSSSVFLCKTITLMISLEIISILRLCHEIMAIELRNQTWLPRSYITKYVATPIQHLFSMFMFSCRLSLTHRHLRNIGCLMAHTTCLVCFISTVNGHSKKRKKRSLLRAALVAGTQQNLSSLYYLDVYALIVFQLAKFSTITPVMQHRTALALVTMGGATQMGLFLFVLLGQGK